MPKLIKIAVDGRDVYELDFDENEIIDGVTAQYQVGERVGGGGMGLVYDAVVISSKNPREIGERRAIKILRFAFACSPQLGMVERFVSEGKIIASLDHDYIVKVTDEGKATIEGTGLIVPFYAMELLEGKTLRHLVKRLGPLDQYLAVLAGKNLFSALRYCHEKKIVHRDVKPANLFALKLGPLVLWKLGDFGLARLVNRRGKTAEGSFLGSLAYAPAEQVAGFDPTPKNDIYSAGAALYEALTGHTPFEHVGGRTKIMKLLRQLHPPKVLPISRFGQFHPTLVDIVFHCLSHDPDKRPTAAEAEKVFRALELELDSALGSKTDATLRTFATQLDVLSEADRADRAKRRAENLSREPEEGESEATGGETATIRSSTPPAPLTDEQRAIQEAVLSSAAAEQAQGLLDWGPRGTLPLFGRNADERGHFRNATPHAFIGEPLHQHARLADLVRQTARRNWRKTLAGIGAVVTAFALVSAIGWSFISRIGPVEFGRSLASAAKGPSSDSTPAAVTASAEIKPEVSPAPLPPVPISHMPAATSSAASACPPTKATEPPAACPPSAVPAPSAARVSPTEKPQSTRHAARRGTTAAPSASTAPHRSELELERGID